jgi:hypothetical protein
LGIIKVHAVAGSCRYCQLTQQVLKPIASEKRGIELCSILQTTKVGEQ